MTLKTKTTKVTRAILVLAASLIAAVGIVATAAPGAAAPHRHSVVARGPVQPPAGRVVLASSVDHPPPSGGDYA
jgi:hypothetical protein